MRLKSIKLAGFKSFVDATTVSFPHNMTAIVGPNGCGKSNVIDAVRWVMGESSAKNLRGESMTDVIFNGSTGRQPVGQASIELLFDNTAGKLVGEYAAFNEISIRRKVTREGVSQYYLNGAKCRRRDVTDIFLGTGMGPRSYAIIEQGMISRLIESKPEELRVYLEEAAGISKYKERRRDTENRIARTRENLDRLADLREELGKQLAHLSRQAKAAEKYSEYKKDERLTAAKLHALNWLALGLEASKFARSIGEEETLVEKAVLARTENESLIERSRLEHHSKQEAFAAIQSKFYALGGEVAKLEQALKYRREQAAAKAASEQKLKRDGQVVSARKTELESELEELQALILELEPELEEVREQVQQTRLMAEDGEAVSLEWEEKWDRFDHKFRDAQRSKDALASRLEQARAGRAEQYARQTRLEKECDELSKDLDQSGLESSALSVEQAQERVDCAQAELESHQEESADLRTQLSGLEKEKTVVLSSVRDSHALLSSLTELQAQAQRRAAGDDVMVLREQGFDDASRLYSRVRVEAGWELAVEHVLGEHMQAVFCDAKADLTRLVASSSQNALSARLSGSLSIVSSESSGCEAVNGSLAACVDGVTAFYPWLNKICCVSSAEQAQLALSSLEDDQSIIMPDGTWLGSSWVRYYNPAPEQSGMVARESQIKVLGAQHEVFSEQLAALENQYESLNQEVLDSIKADQALRSNLRAFELELSQLRAKQSAFQARAEQQEIRLARAQAELGMLVQGLSEQDEVIARDEERLVVALHAQESLDVERESFSLERDRARSQIERNSRELQRLQAHVHGLELRYQKHVSQKGLLEQTLSQLRDDELRIQEEMEELAIATVSEESLEDDNLRLEGLLDSRAVLEDKMGDARRELDEVADAIRKSEHFRMSCESEIQANRERLASLRMEKQALDITQAGLTEKIEQQGFALESVEAELSVDDSIANCESSLASLANKIQRLGAINLAAVDEYDEKAERKRYLDKQNDELHSALEILVDAIKKIDRETRARFKETYDQVNEGLQELFPKIFGGGSAHLELTEADLLETGVAIIARPPGKKNSTIHLLSGGEKALTAIALVFAIFELNPAPFCMLDEVDAPLDDANVGRFAAIVKEMSDRVQFIYISHNKVSMEKADQLMGVTMSEPGVSRLVSVDVDEAAALAQA